MKTPENTRQELSEAPGLTEVIKDVPGKNEIVDSFTELERGVFAALGTYANIHRGSGHNSMVSTHLYEKAREIILEYLGLNKNSYVVIFCTPHRAAAVMKLLDPAGYQILSSRDIGLPLGVRALAVNRKALPKSPPFQSGGGTTKLVSKDWVIWADAPEMFEAGTPAIVNIIAFARALQLIKQSGKDIFISSTTKSLTATDILYHDELDKYSGKELLDELRLTLIGRSVRVPTMEGKRPFINLDNSASTPTFIPVWNAFRRTWGLPGQFGQEIIREVKSICAGFLGASLTAYDIIFTSNTTEAINLAAESLGREPEDGTGTVVLTSLLEHSSNDLPWRMVPRFSLIRLSVDAEGFVNMNELDSLLNAYNEKHEYGNKRIRLVALSGASNVLGICNNIKDISRIVHRYGARLLVDAAQLAAHRKVGMEETDIDYLAFSAHKIYAPFGCGVLVARKGLLNFNSEELKLIQSSGEENVGGIAALGKALVLLQRIGMDLIHKEEQGLTGRLLRGMARVEGLRIYGVKDTESPGFEHKIGVIVFSLKNMMPNRLAEELAIRSGIGVRYGCHCAHIIIKHLLSINPFLELLQRLFVTLFPGLRLPGLVRVSLGIGSSEEDVDKLIDVLNEIVRQPRIVGGRRSTSAQSGTSGLKKNEVQKQMKDFTKAAELRVYSQAGQARTENGI